MLCYKTTSSHMGQYLKVMDISLSWTVYLEDDYLVLECVGFDPSFSIDYICC